MPLIRTAEEKDIAAITAIYNEAVRTTLAIFSEETVNEENRRQWLLARACQGFPVLVCEMAGDVVGYASYGFFRAFSGYRHSAELSIYLNPSHHGRGLGKKLLAALIKEAEAQKIHVLIAGIEASNHISIALHQTFGFVEVGQMAQVGRKFDQWLDLVLMQKILV